MWQDEWSLVNITSQQQRRPTAAMCAQGEIDAGRHAKTKTSTWHLRDLWAPAAVLVVCAAVAGHVACRRKRNLEDELSLDAVRHRPESVEVTQYIKF